MISIEKISPAVLSADHSTEREMPRPPEHRQEGYEEAFDRYTLFCDAFVHGRGIILSGPPLLNLMPAMRDVTFRLNGVLPLVSSLEDRERTQRSRLSLRDSSKAMLAMRKAALLTSKRQNVQFSFGSQKFRMDVNDSPISRFAGRRVLYTHQKDNDLNWIRDWIVFHREMHSIDAVIIYDNVSSKYSMDELAAVVESIDGIEEGVVLSWPFPFGPGAPRDDLWDSDFCQYTAMEHMRRRFARQAAGIINADIDELIVCHDGRTVFDHLAESPSGVVRYRSSWVETASSRKIEESRSFSDYIYRSHQRQLGTTKWTADPRKVPDGADFRVHRVAGVPGVEIESEIRHRHFFGINTDWKRDRSRTVPVDESVHFIDEPLVEALSRVFGDHSLPAEARRDRPAENSGPAESGT